jgi:hypothetical protein
MCLRFRSSTDQWYAKRVNLGVSDMSETFISVPISLNYPSIPLVIVSTAMNPKRSDMVMDCLLHQKSSNKSSSCDGFHFNFPG